MSNDSAQPEVDMHRVLVEIDEEVRALRASGDLAPDLERELDLVFARFAPPGAVEGDFGALIERAEQQSFVDVLAPNESARPGVPQVKRVVQKTVRWYVRYVAEQFASFAHTITKATRMLGDRVTVLEQSTPPADGNDVVLRRLQQVAQPWTDNICDTFKGAPGRVLHARCGTGWLVNALHESKVDAYGVDSASEFVAAGTAKGLDLRPDDEREHLRTLAPGALGGLVISGSVDVLPRGAQIELVDLAALTLAKGARIALVGTNPVVWDTLQGVPTELAVGRPMRAETWAHLLSERGFTDLSVHENSWPDVPPTSFLVLATR